MPIATRFRAAAAADDGFSLVEVMVAFMIFAIIATAATLAVGNGMKVSALTRDRVGAANVAQQQIAMAQAMTPAQLITAPAPSPVTLGGTTYTIIRTLSGPGSSSAASACPSQTMAAVPAAPQYITVQVTATSTRGTSVTTATVISC